jgi:CheY-like chemotaxis protein
LLIVESGSDGAQCGMPPSTTGVKARGPAGSPLASAHVLLIDANRPRRQQLARVFRDASCIVTEASREFEAERTLRTNTQDWVLAVVGNPPTAAFVTKYASHALVMLGMDNKRSISSRVGLAATPELSTQVQHALDGRVRAARC